MLRPRERGAFTTQRQLHGFPQGSALPWLEHRFQAELGGLREATLSVSHGAQLTSETELAEARERPPLRGGEGRTLSRACDRQRNRKISPWLVDPHPADDVDEHVRAARADAPVATEDRQHEREAIAIDPRDDTPRLL